MHKQQPRRTCECDTVSLNRPSPRDAYQPDEQRIPHPECPVHREADDAAGVDWYEAGDFYDLRCTTDGEWVDKSDWDEDTGDRRAA